MNHSCGSMKPEKMLDKNMVGNSMKIALNIDVPKLSETRTRFTAAGGFGLASRINTSVLSAGETGFFVSEVLIMPTTTFFPPARTVAEEIFSLQQTAAVLDILKDGLNDPIDVTHLYAWHDVTELVLQYQIGHLYASINRLLKWIAEHGEEGTL